MMSFERGPVTDLTDGLYAEGGVMDSRNFKFDISESYDNYRFSDLNFFLRMNHSRLVTSQLKWRPELLEELRVCQLQFFSLVFIATMRSRIEINCKNI